MSSKKQSSSSSSSKSKQKPSLTSQLDSLIVELNRSVPGALQKNTGLIGRLDTLCEEARTTTRLDRRTVLVMSQLKEDLAKETYDLLDNHIRKLDNMLAKLDAIPDEEVRSKIAVLSDRFNGQGTTGTTSLNMQIDPSEPTYCICGQVAFGEMISCDGPDCQKEWFHVQCVGKPESGALWYCPDCSRKMANGTSSKIK